MYDLIKGGIQEQKDPIVKDRVFSSIPGFKEWIEQTSLFRTIQQLAGTGAIILGIPDGLQLHMNGISNVESAEDLPIELIMEFYRNSPWFVYDKPQFFKNIDNKLKFIENDTTKED